MRYCILSIILIVYTSIWSQETNLNKRSYESDQTANNLFDEAIYGNSSVEFDRYLLLSKPPNFSPSNRKTTTAEIDKAIAAIRINAPDAESELIRIIQFHYNKPEVITAILELASFYYNNNNFEETIKYYDLITDTYQLSDADISELSFKKGYSYFVNKRFSEAKAEFQRTKELRDQYFYSNNYYYGMCQYFQDDYEGAIESFKRAANSELYKNQIPYYLSQIYFAKKDLDKLISYGEQKINDHNINNIKEIRQLLGQTYFLRNDFNRALPHLEYYEANTEKLTAEEFYQLGFTQYKEAQYHKAKENFLELTNLDSKMGQLSNYYLADCLLKTGDKISARSAFKKVASMNYDYTMKEEALFNYGKISAELGSEREAINVLLDISETSRYYVESQEIINDILINSDDYLNSIKIIESLPKLTEKIKKTYQNLCLKQGIRNYYDGNNFETDKFLDKSLIYPLDRNYLSQAQYWKAQLKNEDGLFSKSDSIINVYFESANGLNDLPEEASAYMAHYLQGYNQLKLKNYKKAELQFKNSIVGININREGIKNDYILNRILPDAFIRAGDCLFKQNEYAGAKNFYDQAISRRQGGYIYALFQRGLIEGLMGENQEKIKTMEEIVNNYSNSAYGDDALLQLGDTYLSLGDREKAAVYFIDIMSKYGPKSEFYHAAMLKMGLITFNRGEVQKAIQYYKDVVGGNPSPKERKEALSALEEIYVETLVNTNAYLQYLDSIPGYTLSGLGRDSLQYHLAYTLFSNSEYKAAAAAFTAYLDQFSLGYYKNDAKYYRAESNNVLKLYQKSLLDYEGILADGKGKYYDKSLFKAGLIAYNFTQDFSKALKYYKEYETITSDIGELFQAQFGALKSAFKIGKDTDIFTYGQKVVENAASTKEEKATAYYYLGKTYLKNNQIESASKAFTSVDQLSNNNQAAEARFLLAEFLFKQDQISKAETQCNYANEKNTNYPYWVAKGLLLLSDVYVKKNDLLNARAALEAVYDNFKDDNSLLVLAKEKLDKLKIKEAEANRIKVNTDKLDLQQNKKKN